MTKNNRIYILCGSSDKMGHFRKAGTETLRGRAHTRRGKIQPVWLMPKDAEKPVDGRRKKPLFFVQRKRGIATFKLIK